MKALNKILLFFGIFSLFAFPVYAQIDSTLQNEIFGGGENKEGLNQVVGQYDENQAQLVGGGDDSTTTLAEVARSALVGQVGTYINAGLGLLGSIALLYIIYAGFLWVQAGGNADKVAEAQKIITNSVIAMLVILSSYAIVAGVTAVLTRTLVTTPT